jgi:transposase
MSKTTTIVAGIDVAKAKMDVAIHGCKPRWLYTNDPAGFHELAGLLRSRKVRRIGLEATGGYERDLVEYLRKSGFDVVVLQPRQVRPLQTSSCAAPRAIVSMPD